MTLGGGPGRGGPWIVYLTPLSPCWPASHVWGRGGSQSLYLAWVPLCHLPDLLMSVYFRSSHGHSGSAKGEAGEKALPLSTPWCRGTRPWRTLRGEMTAEGDHPNSMKNVLLQGFGMTFLWVCREDSKCVWWGPLDLCEFFYVLTWLLIYSDFVFTEESVSICMFV